MKYWVTCADNNGNVVLNRERDGDLEAVKFFAEMDTPVEFHGNICITEVEDTEMETIAKRMIAECLDYHAFDNGQMLVTEPDGVWLCHSDESKLQKISNETWMISGINF